ncbi:pantothenate kinase Ecym_1024 [Eremothecium cymbalariae DBVPG|uniref:Pantothenate kinase n=1 Tax=Eremothecium cymbalariae (strain CBS 270.75 / DBVPG 7215 / KCTC 17166 / NRRL Y-17582) TaxID=931890 RepID=G8JM23_ERECY|nr:hypothetical protein Ecym_1024 [Eremothecium cymbalariae DBVPG\
MSQEIDFPSNNCTNDTVFTVAVDMGGTLTKIVFAPIGSNKLFFDRVETEKVNEFIKLVHDLIEKYNNCDYKTTQIFVTGGGSFKFYDLFVSEFPDIISITRVGEFEGLITGLDFYLHRESEVFTYSDSEGERMVPSVSNNDEIYPYMLVNIGSGVAILRMDSATEYTMLEGSSLGGGTLWGLLSLITGAKTYDEMLTWVSQGDNNNVDMLVRDIYGDEYELPGAGLEPHVIASSFGKVFKRDHKGSISDGNGKLPSEVTTESIQARKGSFKNADISKSLLYAISYNIGQIAFLQAKIHNVKRIYFAGSYIRGHLTTMNTLSYAINFWSKGSMHAFFLKHDGYLGSTGSFLASQKK